MSGEWIKMRSNLAEDPSVIGVAAALGLDEATVVGHLHRLWSWADQQTIDGNATGVTKTWIDRYIGVTGFANALVGVGWLIVAEDVSEAGLAGIQIPKFDVHNSESAKQRALTSRRVAKNRAKNCNAAGVTKTVQQRYQRREEKRREEKKKKPPLNPPKGKVVFNPLKAVFPPGLDTPEFRDVWGDWVAHRAEIRKKLTPTSVSRQLAYLDKMGLDEAIVTINHTIKQGWTGLRPPEAARDQSQQSGTAAARKSPGRVY